MSDTSHGVQKERGCYSVGEKSRPSGWWDDRHITWGAKRKMMLFSRREEEQTQWVVGCQTHHMGCKKKEDVIQ